MGLHDIIEAGISDVQSQLEAQHSASGKSAGKLGVSTELLARFSLQHSDPSHSSPAVVTPTNPLPWLLWIHSQLAKLHLPVPAPCPCSHQKLGGTQEVQGERLYTGVAHAQLAVDAGALDAGEHAQVGAEPRGV